MPIYDFRCPGGHVTEETAPRDTAGIRCPACGLAAPRVAVPARLGITGFTTPPMRERPFHLERLVEAQHELIHEAERTHTELPDLLGMAKVAAAATKKHRPDLLGEAS